MVKHYRTLLVDPVLLNSLEQIGPQHEDSVLFKDSVVFWNGDKMEIKFANIAGELRTESVFLNYQQTICFTKSSPGLRLRGLHEHEYNGNTYKVWVAGKSIVKRYAVIACKVAVSDTKVPFLDMQADPDDIGSDCDYELSYEDADSGMAVIDTELIEWAMTKPEEPWIAG